MVFSILIFFQHGTNENYNISDSIKAHRSEILDNHEPTDKPYDDHYQDLEHLGDFIKEPIRSSLKEVTDKIFHKIYSWEKSLLRHISITLTIITIIIAIITILLVFKL